MTPLPRRPDWSCIAIVVVALAIVAVPSTLFAHPGRLDTRGGHIGRRTGRYHCHTKACRARAGASTVVPSERAAPRVTRVSRVANIPTSRPTPGAYRIHLIDVGTGLSILVQGSDFTFLYDGGSRDDSRGLRQRGRTQSRLLAYLWRALGPSGRRECTPDGDDDVNDATGEAAIDYLILSHPHADHVSMLDDVLACYRVRDVWDAGVPADTVTYAYFLEQLSAETGVRYHTAAIPPRDLTFANGSRRFRFPRWTSFRAQDRVELGHGALMTVLYANGRPAPDPNQNSIVVRLDLGPTSLLLTGDAESGPRLPPESPPGDAEAWMLANVRDLLDVDILQVAHHGSLTSSRLAFLQAVSPSLALIGSGPYPYQGVTLPDPEVPRTLEGIGARVLGTYEHDGACDVEDRVGVDDPAPGGCDNWVIEVVR